jgi:predicted PurR-regulated permease PerM
VSRERLFAAFFFVVLGLLLYQLFLFLAPFLRPLAWAAILALTFYPLTTWLIRLFRGSRTIAATVLVLLVLILAIVPSIFLGSLLVSEAAGAYDRVQELVQSGELNHLIDQLKSSRPGLLFDRLASPVIDSLNLDLSQLLLGATSYVSTLIARARPAPSRATCSRAWCGALMLLALFFFFRDGGTHVGRHPRFLPMDAEHSTRSSRASTTR